MGERQTFRTAAVDFLRLLRLLCSSAVQQFQNGSCALFMASRIIFRVLLVRPLLVSRWERSFWMPSWACRMPVLQLDMRSSILVAMITGLRLFKWPHLVTQVQSDDI